MDLYLIFLGLVLLTVSMKLVRVSTIFKLLGFKKESSSIFKEAVTIALFGFIMLSVAQPGLVVKLPSPELFIEY